MSGGGARWRAVPREALGAWSARLLGTGASLFQLPYWNEPLRRLRFSPAYLTWRDADRDLAWACVLRFGPPGARAALVQRGPVPLEPGGALPARAAEGLARWARPRGIVFLRFTHERRELLDAVAALPGARAVNAFPWYREPHEALLVPQAGSDEELLARFQPLARRKIRKASAEGYRIECSPEPDALARVWPLFERLAARKGFSHRPLESFLELLRLARAHDGARVYTAWLGGTPVEAILVVRDGAVAHYISGALDTGALGEHESPSALLHWRAMRDHARLGATAYDLGTRSGEVYRFKRIFHPVEERYPAPVTLVTNRVVYAAWSATALRLRGERWRRVKGVAARALGALAAARRAPRPGAAG
ncbi:MAG TPA: GNAT family N-acetyltransferase [Gemmatimonadaceae bacterium]